MRAAAALLLAAASLWAAAALAAPPAPPTFPLKDVRPGQKGYGLSVFRGTAPERFEVEVIGVVRHFLPKQDLILIRMRHPVIDQAGIIGGMSGSPVYLDDRVAGAVAYGFPFTKEPIAGVTPIENMLDEMRRPVRGPERTPLAGGGPAARVPGGWRPQWLERLPVPRAPSAGLQRVAVPLSAGGFPESVVGEMETIFAPWRLQPLMGGGAGDAAAGPARFEPGGALGVQIVRGDMSLVGTGTVTYVDGDRVVAFGHPLFGAGEIYAPVVSAEIHLVVPNLMRSFKLSSPLRDLGTLVQDRQAAIVGVQGRRAETIPVRLEVSAAPDKPRVFQMEILRHRILAPVLASLVALAGVRQAASDVADVVVTVRGRLRVRGHGELALESRAFSRSGIDAGVVVGSRPVAALATLLANPFEPAAIERLDLEVSAEYRSDFAEIEEVRLPAEEVDPGARVEVEVVLRPYAGGREVLRVPVTVPARMAGQTLKIVAASGGSVEPERAPPESLKDLIAWLARDYPDDAIVVSAYTAGEGLALRGAVIPDLPPSVLDVLRPAVSSRRGVTKRPAIHVVVPQRRVAFGKAEIDLKVRKEILH